MTFFDTIEARLAETAARQPGVGPSILLGSGYYFNYVTPETSHWTLEDVGYGLGGEQRWSGQCRMKHSGQRVFFYVAQHCCMLAQQALLDGDNDLVFPILNHENGEFCCGDMSSMLKRLSPDYKAHEKRIGAHMNERMGVPALTEDQVKRMKWYDLRMMATEREQLTAWQGEEWEILQGVPAFADMSIRPWSPETAALQWQHDWKALHPDPAMLMKSATEIVF